MVQTLSSESEFTLPQDLSQVIQYLNEMNSNLLRASVIVENMLDRVKQGEFETESGFSLLEVKYHMLLDYLINLSYVNFCQSSGESIENDSAIERLLEIGTVLEKIRPIDHKIRYQIDKLIKTATIGSAGSIDALMYKPNLQSMLNRSARKVKGKGNEKMDDEMDDINGDGDSGHNMKSDSDDEDEEALDDDSDTEEEDESGTEKMMFKKVGKANEATKAGKPGLYVPPKIKPIFYDLDEKPKDREEKILERAKARQLTYSMLEDLKDELLDSPVEISAGLRAQQIISKAQLEKKEYEETYMMRLPITKAEKSRQRKLTTLGTLGDEILGEINREAMLRGDRLSTSKKRKFKGKKRGSKIRKFQ